MPFWNAGFHHLRSPIAMYMWNNGSWARFLVPWKCPEKLQSVQQKTTLCNIGRYELRPMMLIPNLSIILSQPTMSCATSLTFCSTDFVSSSSIMVCWPGSGMCRPGQSMLCLRHGPFRFFFSSEVHCTSAGNRGTKTSQSHASLSSEKKVWSSRSLYHHQVLHLQSPKTRQISMITCIELTSKRASRKEGYKRATTDPKLEKKRMQQFEAKSGVPITLMLEFKENVKVKVIKTSIPTSSVRLPERATNACVRMQKAIESICIFYNNYFPTLFKEKEIEPCEALAVSMAFILRNLLYSINRVEYEDESNHTIFLSCWHQAHVEAWR